MKNFLLFLALFSTAFQSNGQDEKPPRKPFFVGINPSVTIEPIYESGEFDVNILPLIFQKSITTRLDYRITSILNFAFRNASDNGIAHFGADIAFPIFFKSKANKQEVSNGLYLAPIIAFSRNNKDLNYQLGAWIEPGYNILFKDNYALSLGFQAGVTHFIYDNIANDIGNHLGAKIIFGKWF